MFQAFAIAATGLQAQQQAVDTIANNLANVNTPAFKQGRVAFTELVTRAALPGSVPPLAPLPTVGAGVGPGAVARLFEPGELHKTEGPLDIAIQGEGFLELSLPDGSRAYTRGGTLKVNEDGLLATADGIALEPSVRIPDGAQAITIAADGRVQARLAGQSTLVDAGQLALVRFANPQGLLAQGGSVYRATDASGEPMAGRPGVDGLGTLAQGFLEGSNVKLVDGMVDLMVAQRAYQANAKVAQACDDMMALVNGLRR